jgi:hypothetical protein
MKKFKTVEIPQEIVTEYKCDKCGKESEDGFDPYIHTLRIDWNYGSKFDLETWEVDLCEDCLVKMLEGTKVRVHEHGEI